MNRRLLIFIGVVLVIFAGTIGAAAYYILTPAHFGVSPTPATGSATVTADVNMPHHGVNCGVKKNSNGTYTFSWLHVSHDGQVVDENNCIVPLVGFNMGALFLGNAGAHTTQGKILWYKQTFPMNIVRINFNSRWWADNVFVPDANMYFRDWFQKYVKWQEEAGNYVMLDKGPHFAEPPCQTGGTTICANQDQGIRDYQLNPNPETAKGLETYINYDVAAWTDIAKLYANDPAIIYDAWNEPTIKDLPTFYQDMNQLINTIRTQNPRALVIVYQRGYREIMSGEYPNYTQSNLVIDIHIYPKFNGVSPATGRNCHSPGQDGWTPQTSSLDSITQFAQSHGQAVIINEWGGCYDDPNYHQLITSYAKGKGVGLVYFHAGNVVIDQNATQLQINSNGIQVQQAYNSILNGQ